MAIASSDVESARAVTGFRIEWTTDSVKVSPHADLAYMRSSNQVRFPVRRGVVLRRRHLE